MKLKRVNNCYYWAIGTENYYKRKPTKKEFLKHMETFFTLSITKLIIPTVQ